MPLGLSAFSIWGNGVSSGTNGFLGAGLQAQPKVSKSEQDLAHAREAGYFCPLTKAVIDDPVVASDGYGLPQPGIVKDMSSSKYCFKVWLSQSHKAWGIAKPSC